jgi:hypothetical protein
VITSIPHQQRSFDPARRSAAAVAGDAASVLSARLAAQHRAFAHEAASRSELDPMDHLERGRAGAPARSFGARS